MTGFEPRPETVEKAAKAIGRYSDDQWERWKDSTVECQDAKAAARRALAAVLPDVVADVREQGGGITGTVKAMLSERDDCLCCEGPHRFSTHFVPDERLHRYDSRNDVTSWLHSQLHRLPDGARVRISVQALDAVTS